MGATDSPWDFSAALKLLGSSTLTGPDSGSQITSASQSFENGPPSLIATSSLGSTKRMNEALEQRTHNLGTFDKVWDFLGMKRAGEESFIQSSAGHLPSEPIPTTSQNEYHENSHVLEDFSLGLSPLDPQNELISDTRESLDNKPKKRSVKKSLLSNTNATIQERGSQKALHTIGAASKGNHSDDEARRRKIMLELSQTPTVLTQKGRQKLGYASDLMPSSVATRQPLLKTTKSSTLDDCVLSNSVRKTAHLMTLLRNRFSDSLALERPYSSATDGMADSQGIHVFVDISNILIGFHDTLKSRKGLQPNSRMRRQTLSFFNFSLVLERGRPVAKKVLAGSDTLDSIEEAQRLGYTTHILARVEKPERYKGSDSEPMPLPRKVKKGEQAVDEILQLHILNSILDCEHPSTIVLASGDAAEGQFGDGFLKAVERGLRAGWRVEVVAWKASISSSYHNAGWTSRWKSSFRLIELDDFAELLHVERSP